jgi:two-component system cell cycle sensor histidine kinase/response regulator CckA
MSLSLAGPQTTILVAEDDRDVLKVVSVMLKRAGFTVLAARSEAEAAGFVRDYRGTIHLFLADVDIPGTTGPDLANRFKETRPELRVILMSGYADEDLLTLAYGWRFLCKPFLPATLIAAVTEVLQTATSEQTADGIETCHAVAGSARILSQDS